MDPVLIFGNGWLGGKLASKLEGTISRADITRRSEVEEELKRFSPRIVINAAGKTGRPNIDACESDPAGTFLVNTAGPILLAKECLSRGIFMAHLGSGCIYNGEGPYTEDSPPNFFGSVYSRSKILSETALKDLPVLQIRIRMPFDGAPSPRNLITKLVGYRRVISVPNSLTCLDDLMKACVHLIEHRRTGIWNVVNPGVATHDQILGLYRAVVDQNYTFETMPLAELAKVTVAGRSNCVLSTKKLEQEIRIRPVEAALVDALRKYKESR